MTESVIIYLCTFAISCFFAYLYELTDNVDKQWLGTKAEYGDDVDKEIKGNKKLSGKIIIRKITIRDTTIKKFLCALLVLAPPVLLMTFRSFNVGRDVLGHVNYYYRICSIPPVEYIKKQSYYDIEIGFQLLCYIAYKVGNGIQTYLFETALLPMLFFWRAIVYFHKKFDINIATTLFVLYLLEWSYCMATTRFGIALAIFFYSYKFIIERKPVKFAICVLLMMAFHQSLIISVVFYILDFVINEKTGRKGKILAILATLVGIILVRPVMSYLFTNTNLIGKYSFYEVEINASYGLQAFVFPIVLLLPILFNWNKLASSNEKWIQVMAGSMMYIPLYFLMYYNEWFYRLVRVAEILFVPIYGELLVPKEKSSNDKIWQIYILIFLLVGYFINGPIQDSYYVFPYELFKR